MQVTSLETALEELNESALHTVLQSVHSTAVGDDQDLVTPLIPDGDPDHWRGEFRDQLLPRVTGAKFPWLNEAEEVQATKIGAFSIRLPYRDRKDNVHSYFAANPGRPHEGTLLEAVRRVKSRMPRNLTTADLSVVAGKMPRGTNLGWPFFSSDKELIPDVIKLANRMKSDGFKRNPDPCLLFWRGQPRGIGLPSKNRSVWGYPHWLTALELQLQIPLLSNLRGEVEFAAWNDFGVIDAAITYAFGFKGQKISVDFSSYDQTIHPRLVDAVEMLTSASFRPEHQHQIQYVFDAIRYIPLITPEGLLSGPHGMPSGSGLTNYVDGVAQWVGWEYVGLMLGVQIRFICFQGDDAEVIFSRPVDPEDVAKIWSEHFGMRISTEKGTVSERTIHFLQNVYDESYSINGIHPHVRPIMRVLNGMMSYERLVRKSSGWSGYMDSIRWIQQVENARWHPYFHEIVSFLYGHDVYSRTLPVEVIMKRAGGEEKAERILKQPSFPYGKEPLSAIGEFATVKLLNQMRKR